MTPLERSVQGRKILNESLIQTWQTLSISSTEMRLAAILAVTLLRDHASQGLLNARRHMQFVPEAISDGLFDDLGKRWRFEHLSVGGLVYLQHAPVGPNGDLFKYIWKLWRYPARPESSRALADGLHLLLRLIEKKTFHHDISDLKRILKLVPPAHTDLLARFQPSVPQGCLAAFSALFRERDDVSFAAKVDLVHLLDTARGRSPKPAWQKKRAELQNSGQYDAVMRFSRWLTEHSDLAYPFGPGGWSDDVFKRFLKGAHWILEA